MKRVFSLMAALAMVITLSACGSKEKEECKPEVIEKEVIKENIINKEVIKEVEVPVEVQGEFEYVQQYQPGTYFKATEADENGIKTFATVVIDKYGRIAGVHIDNTKVTNKYKIDEQNDKLYVYVPGVEDVIPNAYRLVDLSKPLPTIEDGFTVEDLIEGYPAHDAKIKTLKDVSANETQQIVDMNSVNFSKTWSSSMNKLADRIVKDQTTFGINLFESGKDLMTNSVAGVNHPVGKEIELVQSILDNEAKLAKDAVLAVMPTEKTGLYIPDAYFKVGDPQVGKSGVIYNTAFVVVDSFGEIAGVRLDETYNQNGKATTKWVLGADYGMKSSSAAGKEWFEQVEELENAIVRNQTIDGFKFADANGQELASDKVYVRETSGVEFKNPATLTNLAGTTIKVNGLLDAVKETLESNVKLTLVPGTYYNTDENGNIMSITVANVVTGYKELKGSSYNPQGSSNVDTGFAKDDHKVGSILTDDQKRIVDAKDTVTSTEKIAYVPTYKPVIVGMTLDSVHVNNQAYITIDNVDYELYQFDKGSLDLSLEEVKTPTLIYRDGESYRYAQDENSVDKRANKQGDVVKFEYSGYDEKETIRPVVANSTKQSLKDRYGMATVEGKLEWYEQANAYTDAFIGKDTAYVLNMIDAEHTDSLTGVSIKVNEYNALVVDTLLLATDADNAAKNIVTDAATLDALNGKLGDFTIANGSYYATSDVPNADGGFYTLTVVVYDNKIISIAIDETVVVDGKLTTKASLGKEYKVDKDFKLTDDKSAMSYAEAIAKLLKDNLKDVNALHESRQLLDRYSYELDGELNDRADFFNAESVLMPWNAAAEKVLLNALKNRVFEVMNGVADSVEKQIKDGRVVAADYASMDSTKDGILKITVPSLGLDNARDTKNAVEFDLEELTKTIKVNGRDTDFTIEASADDVLTSTTAKVKFTVEYDDYEPIVREVEVKVQSVKDFKQSLLDSKDAKGKEVNTTLNELSSKELVDGAEITLQAKYYDKAEKKVKPLAESVLTNVIGTNNTNTKINWMIKSLDNVTLQTKNSLTDQLGKVSYDGRDFIFDQSTHTYSGVILSGKTYVITTDANNKLSAVSTINGTQPSDVAKAKQQFLADLMVEFTKDANKLIATVKPGKGINQGTIELRVFFDDYDQDARDGKLGTYQKGEAYRDFSMTVYTKEQAYKLAKERTSVGNILDTVTNEGQIIELTVNSDLKLNNVSINWEVEYSAQGSSSSSVKVETAQRYKDANDNDVLVWEVTTEDKPKLVTLNGNKNGFVEVTLNSKNIATVSQTAVTVGNGKAFGGVTLTDIPGVKAANAQALELAKDGFQLVETKVGGAVTDLRLEVAINNNSSSRVNLVATYKTISDGEFLNNNVEGNSQLAAEFIVAKANNSQYADRVVEAIKADLAKKINLTPFIDATELVATYDSALTTEIAQLDVEGGSKTNVELRWFYEDGREIKVGHLDGKKESASDNTMPSLGAVLESQVKDLEAGEKVNTKISAIATYEVEGVDKEVKIDFNTTVFKNR